MAIQNRRGQSADFVASKMVPGEFAVSQDNRKLYLCFTAGNVKEIAIAEDMANAIAEMNLAMKEWHDEVVEDTEDKVEDAEAWAQGTRGGTPVSSTDPAYQHNAKYYAENIVDNTLSIAGKAADAKKTGDEISDLKDDLEQVTEVVSTEPRTIYTPISFNLLGETRTQNGLTIVQNVNGTVRVYGTANALTVIPFKDASSNQLSFNLSTGETYRLQGCPANGGNSTYRLDLRTIGDQQEIIATDTGSGVMFTVNTTKLYYPYIRIASGATVDQTFSLEVALRSIIESDILSAIDTTARNGLQDSNTHLTKIDLLQNDIPDTVQNYTFSGGSVSQVTHVRNNDVIRTDNFTYGTGIITETRTLYTGESMTIVTNLTTLETTVTYSGV